MWSCRKQSRDDYVIVAGGTAEVLFFLFVLFLLFFTFFLLFFYFLFHFLISLTSMYCGFFFLFLLGAALRAVGWLAGWGSGEGLLSQVAWVQFRLAVFLQDGTASTTYIG